MGSCRQVMAGGQANWQPCSMQTPANLKGELEFFVFFVFLKRRQQFADQRKKAPCSRRESHTFCSHTRKLSRTEKQVKGASHSPAFISPEHSRQGNSLLEGGFQHQRGRQLSWTGLSA